jgi:hypothetical protein
VVGEPVLRRLRIVVRDRHGAPAAGATVRWANASDVRTAFAEDAWPTLLTWSSVLDEIGNEAIADRDGAVTLHVGPSRLIDVCASLRGGFATDRAWPAQAELALHLELDRCLITTVLDHRRCARWCRETTEGRRSYSGCRDRPGFPSVYGRVRECPSWGRST